MGHCRSTSDGTSLSLQSSRPIAFQLYRWLANVDIFVKTRVFNLNFSAEHSMASFRIDDILARPHGSRSETSSGIGVSTPIPNYQQLSFGVDQILARHETEQRERLPLLGKEDQKKCKI